MTDSSKEPSKGAWTPGPWRNAGSLGAGTLISAEDGTCSIAVVYGLRSNALSDGNAKLIAAAPTMAALLRELAEYFKASLRRPEFAHQLADDHPLVRAERLLTDLYPNEEKGR